VTGPAPSGGPPPLNPRKLAVIRASLLGGMLFFGGVVYFSHHRPGWQAIPEAPQLKFVPITALLAGAVGIFGMLAVRRTLGPGAARGAVITIGAWTSGEIPTLAGGVYYWFTDDPQWYFAGLFVFLASLILFPIRGTD
jgi:hypothetical protein